MTWSVEKQDVVRNCYWTNGAAMCPNCDRPAFVREEIAQGSAKRTLIAGCFTCKARYEILPSTDPLSERFRLWSEEEAERLLKDSAASIKCPVDGTRLDIRNGASTSGLRAIRCGRCGNSCTEEPKKRAKRKS